MAVTYANLAVTQLDATPGGALTDYSAYVTNVEITSERDNEEIARGGGNAKLRLVGAVAHAGTMEGVYDPTVVNAIRSHVDQATPVSCTFRSDPQGTSSGLPRRTGELYFTSFAEQLDASAVATWSADFIIDGALTTTAQA